MPPADDPLARLHGRADFYDAIQALSSARNAPPTESWPRFAGRRFDLYGLFEATRALGGIQQVTEKRRFALIRDLLLVPSTAAGYAPFMRNNYNYFCSPWYESLVSTMETTYARLGLAAKNHNWLLNRTGSNRLHSSGELRDRGETFQATKSIDPEGREEQEFLVFPEATQAIIRSRLKENSLEPAEAKHRLFESDEPNMVLLDLRNHLIRMWFRDTQSRLDILLALADVPFRFRTLGSRIYTYLVCTGVINFGALPLLSNVRSVESLHSKGKKIAIIGAGMAGLIAARQLCSFGFNVTIYEARERSGGRVHTESGKFSTGVDMGAMLITGVLSNPVAVLAYQTESQMHFMEPNCPLFDIDGTWVPKETDQWAEKEFNRILDATGKYRNREGHAEKASKMSLGHAFQRALEIRARRRKSRIRHRYEKVYDVKKKRQASDWVDNDGYLEILPSNGRVKGRTERPAADLSSSSSSPVCSQSARPKKSPDDIPKRGVKRARLVEKHEIDLVKKAQKLENGVSLRRESPGGTCQSMDEKLASRLLRWHIANLEYACASDITKVSLMHWDQDDPFGFLGEHVLLKHGYERLMNGISEGLENNIYLNSKVSAIEYSQKGGPVCVEVEDLLGAKTKYQFDSVLVTVPLGVLKRRLIRFEPSLPAEKLQAIDRLGFCGLVKVAMEFKYQFWVKCDMFGALRESVEKRGEFFFFWNLAPCTEKPILMTLVTEPGVQATESLTDKDIVERALNVLRRRYPNAPTPTAYSVSRWSQDEFSGGVYTSIPVGSSGADYDLIEAPLGQNVFFGGEHTTRRYPTTCASAIISGVREAYRIMEANDMIDKAALINVERLMEGGLLSDCGHSS